MTVRKYAEHFERGGVKPAGASETEKKVLIASGSAKLAYSQAGLSITSSEAATEVAPAVPAKMTKLRKLKNRLVKTHKRTTFFISNNDTTLFKS